MVSFALLAERPPFILTAADSTFCDVLQPFDADLFPTFVGPEVSLGPFAPVQVPAICSKRRYSCMRWNFAFVTLWHVVRCRICIFPPSLYLSVYVSLYLFIYLSIDLSICLS